MRTFIFVNIFMLLFACENIAQTLPQKYAVVDLREDTTPIPPVYFLVKNHYQFLSETPIDSLYFRSPCQFDVSHEGAGKFAICKKSIDYSEYKLQPSLSLVAVEHSGRKISISIPVKLAPPVGLTFWFDDKTSPQYGADSIIHASSVRCKAQWDYPEYISRNQNRFRGVFDVDILLSGQRVMGSTGWYDSGDMTRSIDLRPLGKDTMLEIVVREKSLRTLVYDSFPMEFRGPQLALSTQSQKPLSVLVKD